MAEFYPEDAARYYRDDLVVMQSGVPCLGIEEPYRMASGEVRWVRTGKVPLSDQTDRVANIFVMATDITEHRRALEGLRDSERRWKFALEGPGDGVWDWDLQNGEVYYSDAWKRMLGFAADDIGNRLDEWEGRVHPEDVPQVMRDLQAHLDGRTVSYISEPRSKTRWRFFLGQGLDGPRLGWVCDLIDRQTEQMTRLVEDLLDSSRISRGVLELNLEPLAVADIVNRAVESSGPLIQVRWHDLVIQLPPEPLCVRGDPVRLAQVLSNLLSNAAIALSKARRILQGESPCRVRASPPPVSSVDLIEERVIANKTTR